jgi:hypothetical protein
LRNCLKAFLKNGYEDKNINILRFIGVSLILIPIFDNLAITIMTRYVKYHPELFSELKLFLNTRLSIFPSDSMGYFWAGQIIYLFMIEIFRHGLELKSENDLTV